MINLYNIANGYFMAHQPIFMLAMIVGFAGTTIILGLIDSYRIRKNSSRT